MGSYRFESIEQLIQWLHKMGDKSRLFADQSTQGSKDYHLTEANVYEYVADAIKDSNLATSKIVDISDEHNEAAYQIERVLTDVNSAIEYLTTISEELEIRADDIRRLA